MITTVEKLFDIEWGQKEYHSKEHLEGNEGNTILISSKGEDNGVYGFFDIPVKYKAPFVTVPSTGTIGQAFVQKVDCCVNDDVLILKPKAKMSLAELYQAAYQIRAVKWKYQYGRKITPERLKVEKLSIVSLKEDPVALAKQIRPKAHTKKELKAPTKIKVVKLSELFDVKKGAGLYLEKMGEGSTPIISTQTADNGVCGFYDAEPLFKAPCITVGRIMCNPRVQLKDFSTVPDDMFVLTPKTSMDVSFLFYASSIIQTEGWRFSYSRKVTKEKLEDLNIPVPLVNGVIDLDYIKAVSQNGYGYRELQKVKK